MNKTNLILHPSYVFRCLGANQRGDAELFKALFEGQFRNQPYKRQYRWFVKQAGGWQPDIMGEVINAVEDVALEYSKAANSITAKIVNLTNNGNLTEAQNHIKLQKAALRRAYRLRSGAGISACLKMARRDPALNCLEPQ